MPAYATGCSWKARLSVQRFRIYFGAHLTGEGTL